MSILKRCDVHCKEVAIVKTEEVCIEKGCLSRRRGVCQGEGVHCVEVSVDESLFVT